MFSFILFVVMLYATVIQNVCLTIYCGVMLIIGTMHELGD